MQSTVSKIEGISLSLSSLSYEFGVARETVVKRLNQAGVKPSGRQRNFNVYRVRDAAPAILQVNTVQAIDDPDKLLPKERLDHYRAEREKLRLEEEQGRLVPVDAARQEMAGIVKAVVQMLDTLPDILERDCELTPEATDRVQKSVDSVRMELAKELEK